MDILESLLGGSLGESEDIASTIDNFASLLMKLIEIITNFLNGDFSDIFGTEESSSQA